MRQRVYCVRDSLHKPREQKKSRRPVRQQSPTGYDKRKILKLVGELHARSSKSSTSLQASFVADLSAASRRLLKTWLYKLVLNT